MLAQPQCARLLGSAGGRRQPGLSAWAHCYFCILVARSPGLSPKVLQTVHGPAASAWRGQGTQQHRCPAPAFQAPGPGQTAGVWQGCRR
ncbi:hypothetical protein ACRRTK_000001 [Alexandromys fortis]